MSRFTDEFNPAPTDIAICGSMSHKGVWLPIIRELEFMGYSVATPDLSETRDWSSFSDADIVREKGRLIRRHIANIERAKAVLIANFDKNDIENYIGSNTFLEMGAGFIFEKPIYLYNPVPKQSNYEEIMALEPMVIDGDLSKINIKDDI